MLYHVPKQKQDDVLIELNWWKRTFTSKRSYRDNEVKDSVPRFAALNPAANFFEIKQQLSKMIRGVFGTDPAEDDEVLNETIEIQVSLRNLPRNKSGKLEKCEITGKRPAQYDDWSELEIEGTEVNESPDSARSVSLAQLLELMKNRDRLIFCVILTSKKSDGIYFNEFRKQTKKVVRE